MNTLVWKLLRQHISIGQLAGFFLANLFGMMIVLLSVQFYKDVIPVFTKGDSFMKKDFIIATKKVSTLGTFTNKNNAFSPEEIADLKKQPFTKTIGAFTPSQFKVSAGLGMQDTGINLSTEMFFESVPDEFVDINLDKWHFDKEAQEIPIIIPRNYLNLYNFGFAQSRSLPKISEGLMSLIQMNILLRGNGQVEQFKGNIVGFSNRLNTILVPQSFMDWANKKFAPNIEAQPARLIIEVNNPADSARRRKTGCRKNNLFPSLGRWYCIRSRIIYQCSVILYSDVKHLPITSKEHHQTGKFVVNRIQSCQGCFTIPDIDSRAKRHCTLIIYRHCILDTYLLYRQYPFALSSIGNRFIMGSNQHGNFLISYCLHD